MSGPPLRGPTGPNMAGHGLDPDAGEGHLVGAYFSPSVAFPIGPADLSIDVQQHTTLHTN